MSTVTLLNKVPLFERWSVVTRTYHNIFENNYECSTHTHTNVQKLYRKNGKRKEGKSKEKKKKNPTFGGPIIVPVHDCI